MFAKTSPRYSYKTPEKDFSDGLVPWLQERGHKVYQEVRIADIETLWRGKNKRTYGIADIVAIKDGLSHIIEVKARVTLTMFNQIYRYREAADFISVAAPTLHGEGFERVISDTFGIGIIGVRHYNLTLIAAPRRRHPRRLDIAEALRQANFSKRKSGWDLNTIVEPTTRHSSLPIELSLPLGR